MGQDGAVRIGTWNLEGRWTRGHRDLLAMVDADVWLLTEVHRDVSLPGFEMHITTGRMGEREHWAGVFARFRLQRLSDPHPASAAAVGQGFVWCSSILPWRSCGAEPWGDGSSGDNTARAVTQLMDALPDDDLVWGGDWNHALRGREYAGSLAGRTAIQEALAHRRLTPATSDLPHRLDGLFTIDHIAVPQSAEIVAVNRIVTAGANGRRLSDHDGYTVDLAAL